MALFLIRLLFRFSSPGAGNVSDELVLDLHGFIDLCHFIGTEGFSDALVIQVHKDCAKTPANHLQVIFRAGDS